MNSKLSPEMAADRRGDLIAYLFVGALLLIAFVVQATSVQMEAARNGVRLDWRDPWIREGTAHLGLLLLTPIFPFLLDRAPLWSGAWARWAVVQLAGLVSFFAIHVVFMAATRHVLFPAAFGRAYNLNLFAPSNLIYEFRKDALAYLVIMFVFIAMRAAQQRRLDDQGAMDAARRRHRIEFKSGGATVFLNAPDIKWAKAAGNYVEINAHGKTHLVRMTLSALDRLLAEAGEGHLRIHRSHIVNLDEIAAIRPTGEGDAEVRLAGGGSAICSRRYRCALEAAMKSRAVASAPSSDAGAAETV